MIVRNLLPVVFFKVQFRYIYLFLLMRSINISINISNLYIKTNKCAQFSFATAICEIVESFSNLKQTWNVSITCCTITGSWCCEWLSEFIQISCTNNERSAHVWGTWMLLHSPNDEKCKARHMLTLWKSHKMFSLQNMQKSDSKNLQWICIFSQDVWDPQSSANATASSLPDLKQT